MMSDTINRWAWLALISIAVVLHIVFLARTPLSPSELPQALASLDTVRKLELTSTSNSVLLFSGNVLLFSLFGVGNGIARLIPALAGIVLCLLPLYWRHRLGNVGALTAGVVLLFSPLILFASRRVEGTILSLLAVGLFFTALIAEDNEHASSKQRDIFIALGVSLGLLSGPAFYDLLLTGIVAWLFWHWLQRENIELATFQPYMRPIWAGVVIAVLVSIGFGFFWSGWSGMMNALSHWVSSWSVTSDASHIGALILYEPFTLLLAALGLGYAWRNRVTLGLALALWSLLNLMVMSLRGGAPITGVGTAILSLAYLSGSAMENIIKGMMDNLDKWAVLHIGLAFICLIPALIGATQYANGLILAEQPLLVLSGAVVILALQALLAFLFSLALPVNILWRSAFLGVSVMCLYLQTGFALQLNFVRPTSALEPAVAPAGSPDMTAFALMVDDIAIQRGLREDTLKIDVVGGDAEITDSVRWALRHYDQLKVSSFWPPEQELSTADLLVITPESMDFSSISALGWKGMRFTAVHNYLAPLPGCRRTTTIDCTDLVKWYLFRTSPYPQSPKGLILWVNY